MQPDEAIAEIDEICDEFEREWQTGNPPDLAAWAERGRQEYRPQLIHELVRLDLEYRTKHGLTAISRQEDARNPATSLNLMTGHLQMDTRSTARNPGDHSEREVSRDVSDKVSAETEDGESTFRAHRPTVKGDSQSPNVSFVLPQTPVTDLHRFPFDFGRFVVLRELGRGGMGIVYEAKQRDLGRHVALKTVSVSAATPEGLRRFQHEAEAAAQLKHPGIVQVYEVGQFAGSPWISMELVTGPTLSQLVRQQTLNTRQAAEITWKISEAIAAAHANGIVHRDIKPSKYSDRRIQPSADYRFWIS